MNNQKPLTYANAICLIYQCSESRARACDRLAVEKYEYRNREASLWTFEDGSQIFRNKLSEAVVWK